MKEDGAECGASDESSLYALSQTVLVARNVLVVRTERIPAAPWTPMKERPGANRTEAQISMVISWKETIHHKYSYAVDS